jgi:hypothetical protein
VVAAVAAGAFSMVFSWAYGPLLGMKGYGYSSLYSLFFDLRGIAFAAWTLAAFAIGALAGVLIRRVLPAMFATLAAWSPSGPVHSAPPPTSGNSAESNHGLFGAVPLGHKSLRIFPGSTTA